MKKEEPLNDDMNHGANSASNGHSKEDVEKSTSVPTLSCII